MFAGRARVVYFYEYPSKVVYCILGPRPASSLVYITPPPPSPPPPRLRKPLPRDDYERAVHRARGVGHVYPLVPRRVEPRALPRRAGGVPHRARDDAHRRPHRPRAPPPRPPPPRGSPPRARAERRSPPTPRVSRRLQLERRVVGIILLGGVGTILGSPLVVRIIKVVGAGDVPAEVRGGDERARRRPRGSRPSRR